MWDYYQKRGEQTSVVKCKQAAVWHVCSLVLFRCLAYSDPLQTLGLCRSLSPAQTLTCSLSLSSLVLAELQDWYPPLLDSFIPLSSIFPLPLLLFQHSSLSLLCGFPLPCLCLFPLACIVYVLASLSLSALSWCNLINHAGWSSPDIPRKTDS